MQKLLTKDDLEREIDLEREKTRAEMAKIRREIGCPSLEEFLQELQAAKFDPQTVYPWEK